MRIPFLYRVPENEFKKLVKNSKNAAEVFRKLNIRYSGGSKKIFDRRAKELNLDTSHFTNGVEDLAKKFVEIPLKDILVKNSTYTSSSNLKAKLLKNNIIQNVCAKCGLENEWQGKPIVLQLDHINGTKNDNRIKNLRLLCPNCHSQTKTFCRGKKRHREAIKKATCKCGEKKYRSSKLCKDCNSTNRRKFNPTREELEKQILGKQIPFTKLGEKYGVSATSVRRRAKSLGIPIYNEKKIGE